tara:strand:+ start:218 stop:1369 length:1152 start_codon:yes stop_codon:yes gene_type:complete
MATRRNYGSFSIYKRGKSYQGTAYTGEIDELGKRVRVNASGKLKSEVEQKLKALIDQSKAGVDPRAANQTVSQYLDKWIEEQSGIAERTRIRYQQDLKNAKNCPISGKAVLGNVRLKNLRTDHVWSLIHNEEFSVTQKRSTFNRFRSAIEQAVRLKIIADNPFAPLDPKRDYPKRPKKAELTYIKRSYEDWELEQIFRAAKDSDIEMMIHFILHTGCRIGEALAVTWDNVNLDTGTITFDLNLDASNKQRVVKAPKTDSGFRTIDISNELIVLLKKHKSTLPKEFIGLVFPNPVGGHRMPWEVSKKYKALLKEINLYEDGTLWHGLRHTNATHLVKKGIDVATVSERLGHADAGFTLKQYVKPLKDEQKTAAKIFDDLSSKAG